MGRIVAFTNVTLDGVMQGPGRPDEDRRGGFERGGWAVPYQAMSQVGGSMAGAGGLLLGRRTYEDFHSVWPQRKDNPFTELLNHMPKFVASRTLKEPLPWMNSTLLQGDAADALTRIKQDQDLLILGSGALIQSLLPRGVIDEFILLIHPLVLGTGRRLFPDGGPPATFKLTESRSTENGVVIVTYRPA